MYRWIIGSALALCLGVCYFWLDDEKGNLAMAASDQSKADQLVIHNVYFTLAESTPANREKLVAACRKYLVNHPGVVYFACGTLVPDLERDLNVRDWDVGLHIIFENRAAHDRYQPAPDHLKFIEENRSSWKQVRVFDSYGERVIPKL